MKELHCLKSHFSLFNARFAYLEGGEEGFRLKPGTEARREQKEQDTKRERTETMEEEYKKGAEKLIRSFNEPAEKLTPKQMKERQARLAKLEKEMEAGNLPGAAERDLLAWANSPEKSSSALARKQPKKQPPSPTQFASNPRRK